LQALILAGGSGTRFWPLSRKTRPKQLLSLEGGQSLLQETVERLRPLAAPSAVWICTTEALAAEVRRQLPEVPAAQVLAEPAGRNTAPAIGWAVRSMPEAARRDVIAVLPADHRIAGPTAFGDSLRQAVRFVETEDRMMTLGVVPRWAETGYGYLELGADLDETGVRRVRRFVEKPTAAKAAEFVAAGNYLWNAGIFVFRGTTFLDLLARWVPELADGLERIAREPAALQEIYPTLPADSIDYALMEKLDSIATLPLDCGWSDLGSWAALHEVLPHDGDGNALCGDAVAVDARDNLVLADEGMVAVLGVEGLIVVRTRDAVLVLPKERSQEVRRLIAELADRGRDELL
jgi:mannose-1-phosphate guanylyltransferase